MSALPCRPNKCLFDILNELAIKLDDVVTTPNLEGDQILGDADDVYLRYVARVEDPNKMPPTFRRALAKLIAAQLATALSSSVTLSKELFAQFHDQDLPFAKSTDAIQNYADQLPESDFILARYGGRHSYEPGDPPST